MTTHESALQIVQQDDFTRAYIVAALWSSVGDDGEPLDGNFDLNDFAPETLAKIIADCARFKNEQSVTLSIYADEMGTREEWSAMEQAGHDFWLTRNHHGAGFWDRKELSRFVKDTLTKASHAFAECDLYIGNDGLIYY